MSGDKNLAEAQADFDALAQRVTQLEADVQALAQSVKVMPAEIKTALKAVLQWMDANV